jgi:hypothetical protein
MWLADAGGLPAAVDLPAMRLCEARRLIPVSNESGFQPAGAKVADGLEKKISLA